MWGVIRRAINNNLAEPLNALINRLVGGTTDAANSNGNLMQRLRSIINTLDTANSRALTAVNNTNILTSQVSTNGARVNVRVQRGIAHAPLTTGGTRTVTIASVNMSRSFVSVSHPAILAATLTNATTLTITFASNTSADWQVISFD